MQVRCLTKWRLQSFERLLWMTAAVCFGVLAVSTAVAVRSQRDALRLTATQTSDAVRLRPGTASPGDIFGLLEIPKISMSVPITAGIESSSLLRGVGHIDGTAFPGGLGTLGLAGHRDTYFRALRRIEVGMDIRITDRSGTYHYQVDSTEIVTPDNVDVLAIRDRPELTLVTCYPFDYVGAAPKRFIVHAHLLSTSPDARP